MEAVHARCAGMDISKKDAKVCVRIAGAGSPQDDRNGHDVGGDDQ